MAAAAIAPTRTDSRPLRSQGRPVILVFAAPTPNRAVKAPVANTVAAVLHRDFARERDDATVVVVRP